ncbi:peptidoglycan hydrolase [Pontibacillus chungwhensis BH030062]|uniref:Peptidoglycan hydrolase n=1 Tax=Pontibacillus chungwhensis BH030062 TaxID=1385513 RepID=A0A0A2V1R5_9BACI|nr:glycosyl hydrolase family 18 protein [Pontibacillus chungwhensis]KGP92973.1 peptidoglycan hydrolase [Pontibacillus chungwhensis BH030062]
MAYININTKPQKRTWVIGFVGVLFLLTTIVFWLLYPFPSDERTDYYKTEYPIVFNGEKYEGDILYEDGVYISFEFLNKEIDDDLFFDKASDSLIVTTRQNVYQMPIGSKQYYISNKTTEASSPPIKSDGESIYISADWLKDIYPLYVHYHQESTIVSIYDEDQILQQGIVEVEEEDLRRVRTAPSLSSSYVDELEIDEIVTIVEEKNGFYFIRTNEGIGGYVKESTLKSTNSKRIEVDENKKSAFVPSVDLPVHVTWDQLASNEPLPSLPGVQVVSPTWFKLQNGEGDIRNIASKSYVQNAENKGYSIWALFSNGFDPDITEEALATYDKRKSMIEQLLYFAEIYSLEGLNIDFENVYEKDGSHYTQFIRELTPLAHQQGLTVSVDVTFQSGSAQWSGFYEREELAEAADFIMVMAYDEHWGSSPVAGSVSSLPWVKSNLEKIIEKVPPDQLILGAPLYTRLWKEEVMKNGSKEISSESMSMEEVMNWMKERKLQPTYDPETGQDYVEYQSEDSVTYRIWLENSSSLRKRVELVNQYQLAGIATWSQTFATEEAFRTIDETLNERATKE